MTVRPILRLGTPILSTPARPVRRFTAETVAVVADLWATLLARPGRAGLAAPQIGIGSRICCFDVEGAKGHLVNPKITASSGESTELESCLSIPGLAYPVTRAERVTVVGYDQRGEPVTVSASGLLARTLQHEIDHLDGILYLDRLTGSSRNRARRAARAVARRG